MVQEAKLAVLIGSPCGCFEWMNEIFDVSSTPT